MKIFLFSDLHASYKYLAQIDNHVSSNTHYDAVICAGDIVNMGEPLGFINIFIKTIKSLSKSFFWVPGNNDFGRGYYKLKSTLPSLEGGITKYDSSILCGVGGSPASWSGQYAGESIVDKKKIAGSFFVSHFPPPVVLNWSKNDYTLFPNPRKNFNNQSEHLPFDVRNLTLPASKKLADCPLVHICGHIHHQWGVAYLGTSKVIKLATAALGYYAILDTETLKVEFNKLD